jgi:putative 4'-phosphopantetheinyl transferase HI_0152
MAHFAPQAEQEWFAKQLDEEQAFYRCWCLREAVLKSQGVGIVKLSSVMHLPEQLQIFSDYCSKGELLFTDELPFYFAAFINQSKIQPHFYQWNGKELEEKNIKKSLIYQVNE